LRDRNRTGKHEQIHLVRHTSDDHEVGRLETGWHGADIQDVIGKRAAVVKKAVSARAKTSKRRRVQNPIQCEIATYID
jgi:hypothetical protein